MSPYRSHPAPAPRLFLLPLLALALAAFGCEKSQIVSYEVPKEDHSESALMRMQKPKEGPPRPPSVPLPAWSLPENWVEQAPGRMQRAVFTVGAEGQRAEITVSAFPGDAGGLLANVNRWRGQIDLEPIEEAALEEYLEPIAIGRGQGLLTEMANRDKALIAAVASHEGMAWFFKMDGPTPVVTSQREAFLGFLRSVTF